MVTLESLWQRGKNFLGVEMPVMCGAMTWISESNLVSSVSNAGAFGCLAAGNLQPADLEKEIEKTKSLTPHPFAVNLITIAPNYRAHLDLCIENKVPFIVFAAGIPKASDIARVKSSGARVLCFASAESLALRLIERGADALLLEGSEAGGHIGHVSLAILIQQVLFAVDTVPVFVAGGIGSGKLIPHLLLMGASGVQLGSRFVVASECNVHPKFKEAFIKANAREAIATPHVGSGLHVVPVRALKNRGMDEFYSLQLKLVQAVKKGEVTQAEAQLEVEKFWVGALRRGVVDGDVAMGSLMAGQSVGLVNKEQTLREILDELITDAKKELKRMTERLTAH